MSKTPSSDRKICPYCGAVTRLRTSKCWLCAAQVRQDWQTVGPGHIPVALPASPGQEGSGEVGRARLVDSPARFQFGLSTLLLVTTMVAILCGIGRMAPGLAAFLAVVVALGFIGVAKRSMTAAAEGVPLTRGQKVRAFIRWAGMTVILIVGVAGVAVVVIFVALFIMCGGLRFH